MAYAGPKGQFLPTNYLWAAQQLRNVTPGSERYNELLIELYRNMNDVALAVNNKTTGYFDLQPYFTGESYFPVAVSTNQSPTTSSSAAGRSVQRQVVYIPTPLPNSTSANYPHGISLNSGVQFVHVYGVANNPATNSALPLPYAHPTSTNAIALEVSGANVVITTGSNRTAYTRTTVVLEFITE